jgi:hypothetical protein
MKRLKGYGDKSQRYIYKEEASFRFCLSLFDFLKSQKRFKIAEEIFSEPYVNFD